MGWGELTWRCEVCLRERPDDKIGVTKHQFSELITRNVRHCVDNELCVRAAADPGRWELGRRSGNAADFTIVDDSFPAGFVERPDPTQIVRESPEREWETGGFSRWHPLRRWRARRSWANRPEQFEIHSRDDELAR